ncbi:MAG: hypothetical protein IGR93_21615 [Hydrococcus sp. C42_A2020_068]|nr:hypothetical protein [Hydrococcus sp. C42_A2020_068]
MKFLADSQSPEDFGYRHRIGGKVQALSIDDKRRLQMRSPPRFFCNDRTTELAVKPILASLLHNKNRPPAFKHKI